MSKPYRLAILTSHPIQYQAPFFRRLAERPETDPTVYFCSDRGVTAQLDPGFGVPVRWDRPLLDGYRSRFLTNWSAVPTSNGFWGAVNPAIIRALRATRPDALLVYGYALATSWLAFAGAQFNGTPLLFCGETVLPCADPRWRQLRRGLVMQTLARSVDAFLAIGSRSAEFYAAHGIAADRVFLAPYAVDNEYFVSAGAAWRARAAEVRRDIGLPARGAIVLYVSKLTERKRPLDLLRAFERLDSDALLLFVGDGPLRRELETYVHYHGVERVYFAGFRNQSELPRYYGVADVFVLPSSYEPWGLVVNEAMCCGLPVITTTGVAAAQDLVRHGENGFRYAPGDVDALALHLRTLMSNPERGREMGRRSRAIISTWDYEACIQGLLDAIGAATARRQRTAA